MNLLGLHTQFDPNDGSSAGPAFVPTDIDPNNQTRSDARRAYYDPFASRSNFHVITGQHVTRILIAGIHGNNAVTNPTAGDNDSGDGPTSGDNEGFGFGPEAATPHLAGQTSTRFVRRQNPARSKLRITGVEVSRQLLTMTSLIREVRSKCVRSASKSVCYKRGDRCCWCFALSSASSIIGHRACLSITAVQHPTSPGPTRCRK